MNDHIHQHIREMLNAGNDHDCAGYGADHVCVKIVAFAELPSRFGDFHIVAFSEARDRKEHVAIVRGTPWTVTDVPVRLHSECLTGDALGSLRCDCRDQLERSLRHVGSLPRGIVLYMRQEGRGIGLTNKIRAYGLQERGLDTVDANRALGFEDDLRNYDVAAAMLRELGVQSIRLMTNNPDKVQKLEREGIVVRERLPLAIPANPHNRSYLATKARRSGHLLDAKCFGDPALAETA